MALDQTQSAPTPTSTQPITAKVLTRVKFKGHGSWYLIQIKDQAKTGSDFYLRQDRHFAELDEALKSSVQSRGGQLLYGSSDLLRDLPDLPWSGLVGIRLRMSRMGFGFFDVRRRQSLQAYLNQILEQIGDMQKEPLLRDFFREEGHPDSYEQQLQREIVKLPREPVPHSRSNGTDITSSLPVQPDVKEGYEAHPPNFTATTPFLDRKGDDEEDDDAQWNDGTRSVISLCVTLPTNKKPPHPLIHSNTQDEAGREEEEQGKAEEEGQVPTPQEVGSGQLLPQLKQSCSIVVFPSLNASPKHRLLS